VERKTQRDSRHSFAALEKGPFGIRHCAYPPSLTSFRQPKTGHIRFFDISQQPLHLHPELCLSWSVFPWGYSFSETVYSLQNVKIIVVLFFSMFINPQKNVLARIATDKGNSQFFLECQMCSLYYILRLMWNMILLYHVISNITT
jgi:hypothetical protein